MFAKDDWSSTDSQLSLARALQLAEINGRPTEWLERIARLKEEHQQFAPLAQAASEAAESIRTGLPWSDRCQDIVSKSQGALATLKTTLTEISKQPGLAPAAGRTAGELSAALGGEGMNLAR